MVFGISNIVQQIKVAAVLLCLLLILNGCGGSQADLAALVQPETMPSPPAAALIDKSANFDPTAIDDGTEPLASVAESPEKILEKIGNNNRLAAVFEAWYALRSSWLSRLDPEGPRGEPSLFGSTVGNWDYISSDRGAFDKTRAIYGGNSSVAPNFAVGNGYGIKGGYTRGGQCVYFCALILRRAVGYDLRWSWKYTPSKNDRSARYAQPGDLVYRLGRQHLAVCAQRLPDGVDLVDSNWTGYGQKAYSVGIYAGQFNSELVSRHLLSNSQIDREGWKTYSGSGRWY